MRIAIELKMYLLTWDTILALVYMTTVGLLLASFILVEDVSYDEENDDGLE